MLPGPSQLNVTCDSVRLDWETTSLSPRSDVSYSTTGSGECSELKSDYARSFLENLPTMGAESYSPKCASPLAVKCYPGPKKETPAIKKFFCHESSLKNVLKLYNCHSKNIPAKDTKKTLPKKSTPVLTNHRNFILMKLSHRYIIFFFNKVKKKLFEIVAPCPMFR